MQWFLVAVAQVRPSSGVGLLVPQAMGLSAEWRIGVAIVAAAALTRPAAFVGRQVTRLVELLAAGVVAVCLGGVYLFMRRQLRDGGTPHQVALWFDDGLEAVYGALHDACQATVRTLENPWRLDRWGWLIVVAIALTPSALSLVLAVPSPPRSLVAVADTTGAVWRPIDGWVMTGRLQPVAVGLASCPASPSSARAAPR